MNLYLVGAGGFAREIYSYLGESDFEYEGYILQGLLSDYKGDLDTYPEVKHRIVDDRESTAMTQNDAVIIAIASPEQKNKLYDFYTKKGIKILSYIHQSAVIGFNVKIGEGTVICPNTTLTTGITLGKCVTVNANSTIGHDAEIGDYSTLSGHCDVTGFAKLGKRVFMGSSAVVIPKVSVGDDAIIGAGSVIVSRVKPNVTMLGNPAKRLKLN
ncbi:UDP-N-acetylbacillosamine N-acetyltransferase [Vibrio chagasii]|uniref:acetyltransferase n=1 Tax=unclassified Vibrio TaxID=2614977 RepID=UPI00149336C4|nr:MULTISPECIES: acetyltransferase [unclassified Vibrio]CAH6800281.1 UDP-N-acetylbacillosamine N-acetyltransferase [Vibrio chagasii]NOI37741.1 acetyltransferase [Vibrio sp. 070316B]NOI85994.1 acetyltransferase [Vibrio sp. 99K-1]CAH6859492.1 UDP-N-acetylbacillosamine N-acetyltransferase [Vibrio chagasii]CAH6868359.1 UDP-N-acetylbacillosamine N-acetyltransferase [Vibrio chagasii]